MKALPSELKDLIRRKVAAIWAKRDISVKAMRKQSPEFKRMKDLDFKIAVLQKDRDAFAKRLDERIPELSWDTRRDIEDIVIANLSLTGEKGLSMDVVERTIASCFKDAFK